MLQFVNIVDVKAHLKQCPFHKHKPLNEINTIITTHIIEIHLDSDFVVTFIDKLAVYFVGYMLFSETILFQDSGIDRYGIASILLAVFKHPAIV
jgi:hypothetical protein